MNNNNLLSATAIILLLSGISIAPSEAREVTITERQHILMSKINKGEKSGELTLKEAVGLRNEEIKIEEKESLMKNNNGGKLSYANIRDIEKDLNKLSDKLQKKELEKRTMR